MAKVKRSRMRSRLNIREAAVMTSIALPHDLHLRVSRASLKLNWSFAEVARVVLDEWLNRHRMTPGTR
jgi:hypothetical protein